MSRVLACLSALALALAGVGLRPALADAVLPDSTAQPLLSRCAALLEAARREVGLTDDRQRPAVRDGGVEYREGVADRCLVEDVYAARFRPDPRPPSAWRWRERRTRRPSQPDIVSHVVIGERRFGLWSARITVELNNEPQPPFGPEPRRFRRAFARALEACAASSR